MIMTVVTLPGRSRRSPDGRRVGRGCDSAVSGPASPGVAAGPAARNATSGWNGRSKSSWRPPGPRTPRCVRAGRAGARSVEGGLGAWSCRRRPAWTGWSARGASATGRGREPGPLVLPAPAKREQMAALVSAPDDPWWEDRALHRAPRDSRPDGRRRSPAAPGGYRLSLDAHRGAAGPAQRPPTGPQGPTKAVPQARPSRRPLGSATSWPTSSPSPWPGLLAAGCARAVLSPTAAACLPCPASVSGLQSSTRHPAPVAPTQPRQRHRVTGRKARRVHRELMRTLACADCGRLPKEESTGEYGPEGQVEWTRRRGGRCWACHQDTTNDWNGRPKSNWRPPGRRTPRSPVLDVRGLFRRQGGLRAGAHGEGRAGSAAGGDGGPAVGLAIVGMRVWSGAHDRLVAVLRPGGRAGRPPDRDWCPWGGP